LSFVLLYQDRLPALINFFAIQSLLLSLSVAWQALAQGAPQLLITAGIAFFFKAVIIPIALHRLVRSLNIHRDIATVGGIGPTMLLGMALVGLALALMLRATPAAGPIAREDL